MFLLDLNARGDAALARAAACSARRVPARTHAPCSASPPACRAAPLSKSETPAAATERAACPAAAAADRRAAAHRRLRRRLALRPPLSHGAPRILQPPERRCRPPLHRTRLPTTPSRSRPALLTPLRPTPPPLRSRAPLPPIAAHLPRFFFKPARPQVYLGFCGLLIGYSVYVIYAQSAIWGWKLLLLLLQVYMCRVVLRFYSWLRRLSTAERTHVLSELRASEWRSLLPW